MSTNQKWILAILSLITTLACLSALGLTWARFVPAPVPPTPTPVPTITLAPTPVPTNTPRPDVGGDIGAIAICKQFVEKQLIAPRDAKWPGLMDSPDVRRTGPITWRVAHWVDAANRMGVHLRTDYVCIVRYLGDDQWQLELLELQEHFSDGNSHAPTPWPTLPPARCRVWLGDTYIEVDCDQLD